MHYTIIALLKKIDSTKLWNHYYKLLFSLPLVPFREKYKNQAGFLNNLWNWKPWFLLEAFWNVNFQGPNFQPLQFLPLNWRIQWLFNVLFEKNLCLHFSAKLEEIAKGMRWKFYGTYRTVAWSEILVW
jgi:hypothetical protein